MSEETPVIEQKESIKLIKNSKGYNWEIKMLGDPCLTTDTIAALKDIDDKLRLLYPDNVKGGIENANT